MPEEMNQPDRLHGTGEGLLAHVLKNDCRDPDCEVHNIEVALEERTVNKVDVAFWLAGFAYGVRHFADDTEFSRLTEGLEDTMRRAFTRTVHTDLEEDR